MYNLRWSFALPFALTKLFILSNFIFRKNKKRILMNKIMIILVTFIATPTHINTMSLFNTLFGTTAKQNTQPLLDVPLNETQQKKLAGFVKDIIALGSKLPNSDQNKLLGYYKQLDRPFIIKDNKELLDLSGIQELINDPNAIKIANIIQKKTSRSKEFKLNLATALTSGSWKKFRTATSWQYVVILEKNTAMRWPKERGENEKEFEKAFLELNKSLHDEDAFRAFYILLITPRQIENDYKRVQLGN